MPQWDKELADLMTHRGAALNGYAYLLCGDRHQAEDLVQEALVRTFSRFRRPAVARVADADGQPFADDAHGTGLDPAMGIERYVKRAMTNIYVDGFRRRSRWFGIQHLLADDGRARSPEHAAAAKADIEAALGQLSPRQRAVVVLRHFEDMTVPQISATLGIAQGTVKRHLSDAMSALQDVMDVQPGGSL
ncbi:sigma-70 family RNA polymerase sigma factor [Myceligenerans pegani]|uniref:Sigma-70 family RNA polymerase sigma factor n=1 Tax=Myceligenerans pegani TaxID=2776917 RepID=A0ABR9N1L6_9MICO|nr:sigma-70 family RNA polymerase sigma factor [Myceligenerans sp. TRM 65318]MBE1876968.1 sigma-70 family RNA polymerase sigma factor [Myceligenerans sp. TRM 65318]MBE3019239.1 sigma-70 family RNA polymerase sigma factor [Myceligenerans sp. TRM 65318]